MEVLPEVCVPAELCPPPLALWLLPELWEPPELWLPPEEPDPPPELWLEPPEEPDPPEELLCEPPPEELPPEELPLPEECCAKIEDVAKRSTTGSDTLESRIQHLPPSRVPGWGCPCVAGTLASRQSILFTASRCVGVG